MNANLGQGDLVRELSGPLAQSKGWIKLVAVLMIIMGVMIGITIVGLIIAWLPVWMGVLLWQTATAIEDARLTGQADAMMKAMTKLKTYFVVTGVLTLLGLILNVLTVVLGVGGAMMGGMPH